jgi:hypothetical protein
MERQTDTGDIKKRCLCPAGKTGQGCSTGKARYFIGGPHLQCSLRENPKFLLKFRLKNYTLEEKF